MARYTLIDTNAGRTHEGDADTALLVVPGKVILAGTPAQVWPLWCSSTEHLRDTMPVGEPWQALHVAANYAAVANRQLERNKVLPRTITTASQIMQIVHDVLGVDAHAKVSAAIAERMLGRPVPAQLPSRS